MSPAEIVARLRTKANDFAHASARVDRWRCSARRLNRTDLAATFGLVQDLEEVAMTLASIAGQIEIERLTNGGT